MSDLDDVTIGGCRLIHGDCVDVLPTLGPVSAIVTDPPYGLKFMGKSWDYDMPPTALWAMVLDRLLPGGHLLAFAGTRTQHRMAVRIEDAGFQIRDMLAWVYGSGFPKSHDVGKAIDKAAGASREKVPATGGLNNNRNLNDDGWSKIGALAPEMDSPVPATALARQWNGWGTALKPAFEPITLARKPLVGTVAKNVQTHGTGGLNIDGCRVDGGPRPGREQTAPRPDLDAGRNTYRKGLAGSKAVEDTNVGRWPANLIHDGSEEVLACFPDVGPSKVGDRVGGCKYFMGGDSRDEAISGFADSGSAARFFYCAKASAAERGEGNEHPTVKPLALMRWLLTLVTTPGGVVLDPFMGSGSTGVAAANLGVQFIGIERDRDSFDTACRRIAGAHAQGRLPLAQKAGPLA